MAEVSIRQKHTLEDGEIRLRAEKLADELSKQFTGFTKEWKGNRLMVEAKSGPARGAAGYLELTPGEVHIFIRLPGLLGFAKSSVEKAIKENIDKHLKA